MNITMWDEGENSETTEAAGVPSTPISASQLSAVSAFNAIAGTTRLGGTAAFLDIHYHGSSASTPAGTIARPGGTAAFLDIHYHGSSASLPGREAAASSEGELPDEGSLHIYGE